MIHGLVKFEIWFETRLRPVASFGIDGVEMGQFGTEWDRLGQIGSSNVNSG